MTIVNKKGRALNRPRFGCLSDFHAINITNGCEFRCVYCYARGYPGAPEKDVLIYGNLPEKLSDELKSPGFNRKVTWVVFGTASDSFQRDPAILDITYECMRILLENEKGVSFLTKGWIPDRFVELFSHYLPMVRPRIGIVSVSEEYRAIFEPGSATMDERIDNLKRLRSAGLDPEVRVDPIIPFLTDTEDEVFNLCRSISPYVKKMTISYLHLRPAILEQLKRELPGQFFELLYGAYPGDGWTSVGTSTRIRLLPPLLREKGHRRFKRISHSFGVSVSVCACKNPDLSNDKCLDLNAIRDCQNENVQLRLFE